MKRRHVMTPARRAALRKAQLASARKRRMVTVYHHTSPRRAKKIIKQQKFKTHSGLRAPGNKKGYVYVTRRRSKFYQNEFRSLGRKSAVVAVRVPQGSIKRDPNDAWFLNHPAVKTARHKPANAYMINSSHLNGRKITIVYSPPKKKRRRR